MALFGRSKDTQKEAMVAAKRDFEIASDPDAPGSVRRIRSRVALRCKALLDKTFVDGAQRTERHEQAVIVAINNGKPQPEAPKARAFGTVPAFDHEVMAFLPQEFADRAFDLGRRYQRVEIDAKQAIDYMQALADEVCATLQVDPPFEALRFLRDEITAEEGEEDGDEADPQEPPRP
ncbi:MAG: hypothetical protein EBU29_06505 [Gammaproteobacteria bacterium]|jgi:hypothetical protein|nr:hypothetical protein [Gammaproteobacteria bacterium]